MNAAHCPEASAQTLRGGWLHTGDIGVFEEEVSVIGRPDPEWGEVVVAHVAGEASAQQLDRLCPERIARFKRPKDYVFVEALPKRSYGKALKTALREQDARRRDQEARR